MPPSELVFTVVPSLTLTNKGKRQCVGEKTDNMTRKNVQIRVRNLKRLQLGKRRVERSRGKQTQWNPSVESVRRCPKVFDNVFHEKTRCQQKNLYCSRRRLHTLPGRVSKYFSPVRTYAKRADIRGSTTLPVVSGRPLFRDQCPGGPFADTNRSTTDIVPHMSRMFDCRSISSFLLSPRVRLG